MKRLYKEIQKVEKPIHTFQDVKYNVEKGFQVLDNLKLGHDTFTRCYEIPEKDMELFIFCSRQDVKWFKLVKRLNEDERYIDCDYNKYCYYNGDEKSFVKMLGDIKNNDVIFKESRINSPTDPIRNKYKGVSVYI